MNIETKHYKDSQNNIFGITICEETKDTWHDLIQPDWVEITFEEAQAIANPPPNQEQLNQLKEAENIAFLSSETRRVNDAITPLDDAIEFEMAADEEIVQHKELRKYRLLLSRVPNQAEYPLNPIFPDCPEFFKQ